MASQHHIRTPTSIRGIVSLRLPSPRLRLLSLLPQSHRVSLPLRSSNRRAGFVFSTFFCRNAGSESATTHEGNDSPFQALNWMLMARWFLTLIAVTAASLIGSNPTAAQQIPSGEEAGSVQIVVGPALESVA